MHSPWSHKSVNLTHIDAQTPTHSHIYAHTHTRTRRQWQRFSPIDLKRFACARLNANIGMQTLVNFKSSHKSMLLLHFTRLCKCGERKLYEPLMLLPPRPIFILTAIANWQILHQKLPIQHPKPIQFSFCCLNACNSAKKEQQGGIYKHSHEHENRFDN